MVNELKFDSSKSMEHDLDNPNRSAVVSSNNIQVFKQLDVICVFSNASYKIWIILY